MNIQLKKFNRVDDVDITVTYEGTHERMSDDSPCRTVVDFEVDLRLRVYPDQDGNQVNVLAVRGFDHLSTKTVEEAFSEIARIGNRIVDCLAHTTKSDLNIPLRMVPPKD